MNKREVDAVNVNNFNLILLRILKEIRLTTVKYL